MVGYVPDDTLSNQEKVVAGSTSGIITRFITQPLEVIKLRIQLQKLKKKHNTNIRKKPNISKTAKGIYREEGITAFWYGHKLGQMHSILSVSCQFQFFEFSTGMLSKYANNFYVNQRKTANFLCGVFSGSCTAAVMSPIEVIRVRQMVGANHHGLWEEIKYVYSHRGVQGFYKGISASVLQTGLTVGISFGVFTTLQPLIIRYLAGHDRGIFKGNGSPEQAKTLMIASSLAATASGLIAKTATYPFDLAKRRLQMSAHQMVGVKRPSTVKKIIKCETLLKCLEISAKKDGIRGPFRGLIITLIRAQISSVVAFTTYEMICFGFRNKGTIKEEMEEIKKEINGIKKGIIPDKRKEDEEDVPKN